jgi:hypothetical protein
MAVTCHAGGASISFAVKSVSTAEVATHSLVTRISLVRWRLVS